MHRKKKQITCQLSVNLPTLILCHFTHIILKNKKCFLDSIATIQTLKTNNDFIHSQKNKKWNANYPDNNLSFPATTICRTVLCNEHNFPFLLYSLGIRLALREDLPIILTSNANKLGKKTVIFDNKFQKNLRALVVKNNLIVYLGANKINSL